MLDEKGLKAELQREYALRFTDQQQYRDDIWKLLTAEFFQAFIPEDAAVLDLGCGWGEFINHIRAGKKYGMDLNPESRARLAPGIEFLEQDCSAPWQVAENSLDCVFTSNFFEHLREKDDLRRTLLQVHRCLKPGGRIICMGPNIKFLPGAYWDFWDHYLALTELSLSEILNLLNFRVETCHDRFLPYTMAQGRRPPLGFVSVYLRVPLLWKVFGKQFLVIARAEKTA